MRQIRGSAPVRFSQDEADERQIRSHLELVNSHFVPPLDQRVSLDRYSAKIRKNAITFEAWTGGRLAGLVACYMNDPDRTLAYITHVAVDRDLSGQGIASHLIDSCVAVAVSLAFEQIELEVDSDNRGAISLYERNQFKQSRREGPFVFLVRTLPVGEAT